MIKGVRHTGIIVRDISVSLRFYRDLLGFTMWKDAVEEGEYIGNVVGIKGARIAWVKLNAPDGSLIELIQYLSENRTDRPAINNPSDLLGSSHVALTVDGAEDIYTRLLKSGYHCVNPPQISPDGLVKVFYCHDPDGVILEFVEELKE